MSQNPDFVILSDLHFMLPGKTLYGIDPVARLEAAIAAINRQHANAECVVLNGDLAHHGEAAAYESLSSILATLSVPVVPLLGNHDRRGPFLGAFPDTAVDPAGFVQSVRHLRRCTLLTLDTLNEGGSNGGGTLCEARQAFLEKALRDAPRDKPLFVFMHHPPFAIGASSFDVIRLDNPDTLWATIERAGRRPDHLFCGHVHQAFGGTWRGISVSTQVSLLHQLSEDGTTRTIQGSQEPPGYCTATIADDGLRVRHSVLLYEGPVFNPKSPDAIGGRF